MHKRILIITIAAFLLAIVLACNIGPLSIDLGLGGDSDSPSGDAGNAGGIEAGINGPVQGAVISAKPIEIAYYATSVDGVATVELSVDGEILNIHSNPDTSQQVVALKYSWDPSVSGSHTIRVRAQDAKGNWSNYAASTVTVELAQSGQQDDQAGQQDNQDSQPAQPAQPAQPDTPQATATPEQMTVYNVKHDKDIFYWGDGTCGSREITIEADITHPDDAYAAIIFFRFWDNEGQGLSSWSSGNAMSRKSDEHFSITLASDKIPNYNLYDDAVLYYQIKVQSEPPNPTILAGTEVIKEVELQRCP